MHQHSFDVGFESTHKGAVLGDAGDNGVEGLADARMQDDGAMRWRRES